MTTTIIRYDRHSLLAAYYAGLLNSQLFSLGHALPPQVVEMSFNMWYRLSEYLYHLTEADFELLRPTFLPYTKR